MEARKGPSIIVVLLGASIGFGLAVLAQQAGAWPLDRLATFGLPAVIGAAALGIMVLRRGFTRRAQDWVAILIVILLLIFALTGIGDAFGTGGDAQGYLNNCTLNATSTLDTTTVNDSSRANPFDVDPAGEVSYEATSPGVITDHVWSIYVDVAGFKIQIADGTHPNTGEAQEWSETVDAGEQVEAVEDVVGELRGIFLVGGEVVGSGGACDGQGWVRFPGSALANIIGKIVAAIVLILLIILMLILLRRGTPVVPVGSPAPDDGAPPPAATFDREPLGPVDEVSPEQAAAEAAAITEALAAADVEQRAREAAAAADPDAPIEFTPIDPADLEELGDIDDR